MLALPVSQLRTGRHLFYFILLPSGDAGKTIPTLYGRSYGSLNRARFQIDPRLFPAE